MPSAMPEEAVSGASVIPIPSLTVREVFSWYESVETRSQCASAAKERKRQRDLFAAVYGHLPVERQPHPLEFCKPLHLLEFLNSQSGAVAAHTRRRIKASVSAPFNKALELCLIGRNPVAALKLPMGKRGRDWTDEEFRALLDGAPLYMRLLLATIRFSGARRKEICDLRWDHIRKALSVAVIDEHKTSWCVDEPRRIYLNHATIRIFIWIRRLNWHPVYVFANRWQEPWKPGSLTKHLRELRERAGLSDKVKLKGGRHYFCTRGLMAGVDLATMSKLLGHKSIQTTQVYEHLIDKNDYLSEAAELAIRPIRRKKK